MWKPRIASSLVGDDLKNIHLLGSKCESCKREYFPARKNCPHCLREDTLESIQLSDYGKLHSYVICQVAPPGYDIPHTQGYIDLDNDGPRIFAILIEYGDAGNLYVGRKMELKIVPYNKNETEENILEYRFRPV
ncbi:Zn-ribbon domain-containing OB-fold protein [Thermodesulfobacteriota bacterium]